MAWPKLTNARVVIFTTKDMGKVDPGAIQSTFIFISSMLSHLPFNLPCSNHLTLADTVFCSA